jgi:hypothetical protein
MWNGNPLARIVGDDANELPVASRTPKPVDFDDIGSLMAQAVQYGPARNIMPARRQ